MHINKNSVHKSAHTTIIFYRCAHSMFYCFKCAQVCIAIQDNVVFCALFYCLFLIVPTSVHSVFSVLIAHYDISVHWCTLVCISVLINGSFFKNISFAHCEHTGVLCTRGYTIYFMMRTFCFVPYWIFTGVHANRRKTKHVLLGQWRALNLHSFIIIILYVQGPVGTERNQDGCPGSMCSDEMCWALISSSTTEPLDGHQYLWMHRRLLLDTLTTMNSDP